MRIDKTVHNEDDLGMCLEERSDKPTLFKNKETGEIFLVLRVATGTDPESEHLIVPFLARDGQLTQCTERLFADEPDSMYPLTPVGEGSHIIIRQVYEPLVVDDPHPTL